MEKRKQFEEKTFATIDDIYKELRFHSETLTEELKAFKRIYKEIKKSSHRFSDTDMCFLYEKANRIKKQLASDKCTDTIRLNVNIMLTQTMEIIYRCPKKD